MSEIVVGDIVTVIGLISRPDLNGRSATVVSRDTKRQRWNVRVEREVQKLSLREENLELGADFLERRQDTALDDDAITTTASEELPDTTLDDDAIKATASEAIPDTTLDDDAIKATASEALPAALRECLREGSGTAQCNSSLPAPRLEQKHVLYIIRTAFRAEANPSLEVALHTARALRKPLVCLAVIEDAHPPCMQALSRRPTDRAAAFKLEALRELQPLFAARGTALYVHVERDGCRADAALSLAARACVVVTDEHYGIAPHAPSTERVAMIGAPVWLCDCHTTLPSATVPAAALRGGNAAFLRATATTRVARLQFGWFPPPASAPAHPPPSEPPLWSSDLAAEGAVVRAQ